MVGIQYYELVVSVSFFLSLQHMYVSHASLSLGESAYRCIAVD